MRAGPIQIVLAAGRSRRMGSPKPLLDFDGRTALELVLAAGRAGGCSHSIVVVGHAAERVRKAHERVAGSITWVVNEDPRSHQLASLQLALATLVPPTTFLVHPVDYPLVLAADYHLLIEAHDSGDAADSVYFIAHGGRHGHPVLCRTPVAPKLLALAPERTAREVIGRERHVDVETPNSAVLLDMDTPADYAALLELYRRR